VESSADGQRASAYETDTAILDPQYMEVRTLPSEVDAGGEYMEVSAVATSPTTVGSMNVGETMAEISNC
jgi:hypothetical protein